MKIVLGSSSPRRKELLGWMGYSFSVVSPDIEEKRRKDESPKKYVKRNAFEKAHAVAKKVRGATPVCVIAADTIVVLKNKILEKPANPREAFRMLNSLSGNTHKVFTALCVLKCAKGGSEVVGQKVVKTLVTIRRLSKEEIKSYISSGEPMDKAGAYAAQGRGGTFIEKIDGSFTNVVGLPAAELHEILHL